MRPRTELVKPLDDHPLLPAHVGVDLWRAALAWRERLHQAMTQKGHGWYGDARGAVAQHLDPRGMGQSELVARMQLTKQAVQQLVDSLESDGIVRREPDPNDGRGKRVVYTKKGLAALEDAVRAKSEIEADYKQRLGQRRFETLVEALRLLSSSEIE